MTDYYQTKYLKYKLKYFNLLNQSGGYTLEEFENMKNNVNEKGYLIDIDTNGKNKLDKNGENKLFEDIISHSEIHKDNAIYIDNQIYDANGLSEHIEKYYLNKNSLKNYELATNPYNRNQYKEEDYNLIADHISGSDLDKELIKKRKEIINEIKNLIQLDTNIQQVILQLEPEERKIFLNDDKFKKFIQFDDNTKKELINKIDFLGYFKDYEIYEIIRLLKLNEKIQKEILSLKTNYDPNENSLFFNININIKDQTLINLKNIKNIFLQEDNDNFKFLINFLYKNILIKNLKFLFLFPEKYITDEIIKLDGRALEYLPKDKMTFQICELAVKQNCFALEYVLAEKMTVDQYIYICKVAVKQDAYTLKHVLSDKIPDDEYISICKQAVKQNAYVLEYVPKEKITKEIMELAIKQEEDLSSTNRFRIK